LKKEVIYLLVFIFLSCSFAEATTKWKQIRGEHFIVYADAQHQDFARKVCAKAEEYYHSVAGDLGYVRYSNFWKWDKRVKIYIYHDNSAYLEVSGQPQWSHGLADYSRKHIISYVWAKDFLDTLLVHEITHLVFRDFVGFKGEVPLWLDEGIAQWEEKLNRGLRIRNLKRLANDNSLLTLADMMRLDIRGVKNEQSIRIRILDVSTGKRYDAQVNGETLVYVYYLQAFSMVGFMMEEYGPDTFVIFSRQLRDGKTVEEALRHTYPASMRTVDEMETQWRKYISTL